MYSCELCGFNSPSKGNYEKHCNTQKHKKNIAKYNETINSNNKEEPILNEVNNNDILKKDTTKEKVSSNNSSKPTIIKNDNKNIETQMNFGDLSIANEPPMSEDVIQELLRQTEITQLTPERQNYLKKLISEVCKTKNIITTTNPSTSTTNTTTTNNTTVTNRSNNEFTLNIFMNNKCKIRIDITELALTIIGEETNIMENVPEYLNRIIKVLIPIIIQMIKDKEFDY
jgi:hypothetical protein